MAKYIVTAPVIIVYNDTGLPSRVRFGADVPDFVSKDHVKQLLDANLIEPTKAQPASPKTVVTDPAKMKLDQLKAYAVEQGIDLGEATRLDDVRAAVLAAQAPTNPTPGSETPTPADGSGAGDALNE